MSGKWRTAVGSSLLVGIMWLTTVMTRGQSAPRASSTAMGEWPTYSGDLRSTRYSPLDQISADNFGKLDIAWRFRTEALGPRPEYNLQVTPLMVKGVLYLTAGTRRAAVALDAKTGEMLWMYHINEGKRGESAPRQLSGRGLSYWTDGREERIIYVTPGYQMVALNAKTGAPVQSFGKEGIVDLKLDDDQQMDLVTGEVGLHAPPLVVNDVVVVGAAHLAGATPRGMRNEKGYIRGYDVRTGKRLWIFHTIPRPGEFGNDTWENDSWSYTGNAGSWASLTADPELGLVYVPVELPTGDYYGGHRPGKGLFGESLVALDVKTGRRKWHYQLVHHGIWDMDIPGPPVLADITVNGKAIKAIAQPTKQAWLYVFDRVTGEPVWPIEERPVAKGDVPGEWYSPTEPFVTKPPAFDRQGISEDDLIDFTPELHAEALRIAKNFKLGPLFTPPVLSKWPGPLATIFMPGSAGGANWMGGALDPATNYFYVYSITESRTYGLVPGDPARSSDFRYVQGTARDPNAAPPQGGRGGRGGGGGGGDGEGGGGGITVQGLPIIKPPYGRITALDLNKGDLVWQIAHGETPDNIKNHPALKGVTIPRTGRIGRIGVLVTKTLVIAGEGGFFTAPNGKRGAMLRAYDKATGKEVGAVYMEAPQTGSPMTYLLDGQQYLTVSIGGAGHPAELVVFKVGS
jgi:quinoprotein glucose dehydrogenase